MPYTCTYCKRYIVLGNEHTDDCGRSRNALVQRLMVATAPNKTPKTKRLRFVP